MSEKTSSGKKERVRASATCEDDDGVPEERNGGLAAALLLLLLGRLHALQVAAARAGAAEQKDPPHLPQTGEWASRRFCING
ncbi:hypothetical protein NDU88_003316 [Pleurodeles waltl]|uniref:Uncharacterized protein n=1 Tax=Pleurodeles waltl TaxID=8319 RepID=A0AAV7Q8M1_PLEWA|nr:hypothetical protein NDU88_003316 [Pleurodeles waltl]